jgi:hypothetical protein
MSPGFSTPGNRRGISTGAGAADRGAIAANTMAACQKIPETPGPGDARLRRTAYRAAMSSRLQRPSLTGFRTAFPV